ncbi:MAG TPA: TetR/AcrR family transcriptional regulator [Moraxellaceae bacterium]|nr:TetR/AcrR family transcriptional regulator [Moraxellaceae bacterium]
MSTRPAASGKTYHHGGLSHRLVEEAILMMQEGGLAALNLRRLGMRVGVSQTALYHHFKDKQGLLCALGEEGIRRFDASLQQGSGVADATEERLAGFIKSYVQFALAYPELYELMFGRTTWRGGTTATFEQAARSSFRSYAQMIAELQQSGQLSSGINSLRLAQVIWGMLHGLCRMHNDGLLFSPGDVEEISRHALWLVRNIRSDGVSS